MLVASINSVGAVAIVAVVLIVLALVYYLVSTIVQLRKITAGLDEVIVSVGEIIEKSAPVNDVVDDINAQLDAGVDLLEGLLVQKAGLEDAVGLIEGLYAGLGRGRLRQLPRERRRSGRRASARSTPRARSRSPGSAARPRSPWPTRPAPVLRNVEAGSLAARLLYPDVRQTSAAGAAAVAGDRHRRTRAVRAARRHRGAAQAAPRRASRRGTIPNEN